MRTTRCHTRTLLFSAVSSLQCRPAAHPSGSLAGLLIMDQEQFELKARLRVERACVNTTYCAVQESQLQHAWRVEGSHGAAGGDPATGAACHR